MLKQHARLFDEECKVCRTVWALLFPSSLWQCAVTVGVWHLLWKMDRQWSTQYAALETPQSKHDWLHQRLEERYAIEKARQFIFTIHLIILGLLYTRVACSWMWTMVQIWCDPSAWPLRPRLSYCWEDGRVSSHNSTSCLSFNWNAKILAESLSMSRSLDLKKNCIKYNPWWMVTQW